MFDFLSKSFSSIFTRITGQHKLTESNMDDSLLKIKEALIQADVPLDVAEKFSAQIKSEALGKKVLASLKPSEMLLKIVYDKIVNFLGGTSKHEQLLFKSSSIIMLMGLQGAGKTSTAAKLALYIKNTHKKNTKILLASVDFYRPAAIDQLEILSKQIGVDFYRATSIDAINASNEIFEYSRKNKFDILILDTAGRLHIDTNMIDELKIINKNLNPSYKILVLDSMTGQESLKVAQTFDSNLNITGAILTKLDSDTRSGAAFAFKYVIGKPIIFLTTGEKAEDLEQFKPERIANRIVGMGDILTLVEQAQSKIKQSEQDELNKSFYKDNITLQDFAKQLDMINKIGSLSSVMKYLPNFGSMGSLSPEMLQKGENDIKKFKAIINSMTMKERNRPIILDSSRKKRIAKGSGVNVEDINVLLDKFNQGQKLLKMFKSQGFR